MLPEIAAMKARILEESEIDDLTDVENQYLEAVTGLNDSLKNLQPKNDQLRALAWDAAVALGATDQQAAEWCGDNAPPDDLEFNDGYINAMGRTWQDLKADNIDRVVSGAMEIEGMTRDQVFDALKHGMVLKWGKSANYFYDHSDATVRRKRNAVPAEKMVLCDCGHRVQLALVMSASMGTSCPDCYDRMSD